MSDNELLSRLRDGDKEALSVIIERYYEVVFRFCIYMLQKESDAYDITQETFLKFIQQVFYLHKPERLFADNSKKLVL